MIGRRSVRAMASVAFLRSPPRTFSLPLLHHRAIERSLIIRTFFYDFDLVSDVFVKSVDESSHSPASSLFDQHLSFAFLRFTQTVDSEELLVVRVLELGNHCSRYSSVTSAGNDHHDSGTKSVDLAALHR